MSYTPEEQQIEGPVDKIFDAIEEFRKAAHERLAHPNDWSQEHRTELYETLKLLLDVQMKLSKL
jgi:hypothetical protein